MKTSGRVALAIALVLIVGLSLFLIPRQTIMSLTTALTTSKAQQQQPSDYLLGETITFVGSLNFTGGESKNITGVSLNITGPQPLTNLALPIEPGVHNLTANLPKDNSNNPLGTLTATVATTNMNYVGYGYGYGYAGYGGGSITYTINYKPPVNKYPAPSGQAPGLPATATAFPIPGAGEGESTLAVDYIDAIPGAPGAPKGSVPVGVTANPYTGTTIVLVRGNPVDVLLDLNVMPPYNGTPGSISLNSFKALDFDTTGVTGGINNSQDVIVFEGNLFIVHGPAGSAVLRRIPLAEWNLNNSFANHVSNMSVPGQLLAGGLSTGSDMAGIYISFVQTDPALGIPFKKIDPHNQGSVMDPFPGNLPAGPTGGGYSALTYLSGPQVYLGAYNDKMADFANGIVKASKTLQTTNGAPATLTQAQGMTIAGYNTIYLADGPAAALYSATVESGGPTPSAGVPRDIASDGTNFWLLIDGNSNDTIIKVSPAGTQIGSTMQAPSDSVESLVYLSSSLYLIDNSSSPKRLYKINPSNGQTASGYPKNLAGFIADIGGLSVDTSGTKLVAAERYNNFLHIIDPATGALENTLNISTPQGQFNLWVPGGLEAITLVNKPQGGGQWYLGGRYNNYFRINTQNGSIEAIDPQGSGTGQPPYDITGLTGTNPIYIADAATPQIYKASMPGTPAPNPLTNGSYEATFTATAAGFSPVASPALAFTIGKQTAPAITITSPVSGSASTSANITVTGTVNDPTITSASVGIALPSTELFNSTVEEAQATLDANWPVHQGLWHASTAGKKIGTKSWYYGQEPQMNYETPGLPNMGDLDTKSIAIGQNTTLSFYTWYNTEPGFDFDKKLIQFSNGTSTETIAQIIDFFPPPQPGQPFVPAAPGTVFQKNQFPGGMPTQVPNQLIYIPSAYMNMQGQPALVQVNLNLNGFSGQTGKIRFKFDTGDSWGNNFEGWYIDNVSMTGAGFSGAQVAVVNQAFSAPFTLAEGQNTVSASATRSAYDSVTVETSVVVYLDSAGPQVTVAGLPGTTNNPVQTLTGSFTETTPDTLEIYQITGTLTSAQLAAITVDTNLQTYNIGGTTSKLIVTQKSFTTSTFSKSVVLSEGQNHFVARLVDKGGLKGQAIASSALDTTGPTLQVLATSYPTGEVSARPNDFFLFQVRATDTNGIANVKMQMPSGPPQTFMARSEVPEAVLTQWGVNSQATHVFPMVLPTSAPPGEYSLTATATDNGGNTTSGTTHADVVSTLSKFNISLMPNWNLISLPLMPPEEAGVNYFEIPTLAATLPANSLNSVWSYDTATTLWKSYVPSAQSNELDRMENGKGYWVKMNASAFSTSAPLATGLPNTPVPIKLTITGVVLRPAQTPPTYSVLAGWNLVGLHAERAKAVSTVLQPLTSQYGASLWGALVKYQNYIYFPTTEGAEPEVILGSFKSMTNTDSWNPGEGAWLFGLPPGGSLVATP